MAVISAAALSCGEKLIHTEDELLLHFAVKMGLVKALEPTSDVVSFSWERRLNSVVEGVEFADTSTDCAEPLLNPEALLQRRPLTLPCTTLPTPPQTLNS